MLFLPDNRDDKRGDMLKKKHDYKVDGLYKDEMKKDFKDRVSILAVSYHNLAVEQEFLKMYHDSLNSYRQAL